MRCQNFSLQMLLVNVLLCLCLHSAMDRWQVKMGVFFKATTNKHVHVIMVQSLDYKLRRHSFTIVGNEWPF